MKTIATLIFVLLISFAAQANDAQVVSFESGIVSVEAGVEVAKETEVARLYKFKNSLIKKELNFRTKRNNAKVA